MIFDGLWDAFTDKHMGAQSEEVNTEFKISREDQDAWSLRSHQRAAAAIAEGRFKEEIVPFEIPQRKGDPIVFDTDEGVRGHDRGIAGEAQDGVQQRRHDHRGNAPQISDGGRGRVMSAQGRGAGRDADRRDRRLRHIGRETSLPPHRSGPGRASGVKEGRDVHR